MTSVKRFQPKGQWNEDSDGFGLLDTHNLDFVITKKYKI